MNKFMYLTKSSLKKKIGTKWFLVINIILLVVIGIVININSLVEAFGGDFNDDVNLKVVDNLGVYDYFKDTLNSLDEDDHIKISLNSDKEKLVKNIEDKDVIVVIDKDDKEYLKAEIISKDAIDGTIYQNIINSLNTSKSIIGLIEEDIDMETLTNITSKASVERTILSDTKSTGENMDLILTSVFPTLILPFFMLVIFLIQMVGGEICEEKTTRSMEIIISNVSPKMHLFSKVLASNIFVIIQGVLLVIYAGIGLFINKLVTGSSALGYISELVGEVDISSITDKLLILVPFTLVLMLLSFIAYAVLSGILASMTVNIEDFNQLQTPMMIVLMVGYYLSLTASMFNGSTLIHVLSYVPFISAFLSPTLYIIGDITWIEMLISIILMLVLIYLLIVKGMNVYKNGILNYSNDKIWSRVKKSLKN